jgi:hypothetical protein
MPENVRAAADIWQALRSKRGPELLKGLVDELAKLHLLCAELGRLIQQLQVQQNFSRHLLALEAGADFGPRLPSQLEIYASQMLEPQQGFHSLEYDDNGVPFRWTGPQRQFSFLVNIDRDMPLIVELEAMWMLDESRQSDLNLMVDGSILPCRLRRAGSGYIGRALLPAAAEQGTTTLTFILPTTLRPDSTAIDQRQLGIAFRRLAIRPPTSDAEAAEVSGASTAPGEASTAATAAANRGRPLPAAAIEGPRVDDWAATSEDGFDRTGDAGNTDEPATPRTFSCTAAEIRDGHPGFYSLERDDNGVPFRWTGGQPSFSFSVPIDRRAPIELEMRVIAVIDLRRQSPLRLELDGAEHRLEIKRAGNHLAGRLLIPPRAAAGLSRLTFTVPVLLRPKGADRRELGIAFSELHLRPAAAMVPAGEPSRAHRARHRAGSAAGAVARARETARKARAAARGSARAR